MDLGSPVLSKIGQKSSFCNTRLRIARKKNQPVFIPLSAVKFEIEDGYIFTVENNTLVQKPVELGVVRGGSVEVVSGLSQADEFVLDARGLLADTEVEVRIQ